MEIVEIILDILIVTFSKNTPDKSDEKQDTE